MNFATFIIAVLLVISILFTLFSARMALWLWQWRTQVAERSWAAEERVREFGRAETQSGTLVDQDACHWRFEVGGTTYYIQKPQRSAALEAFFKHLPDLEGRTPKLTESEPLRVLEKIDGGAAFLEVLPPVPKAKLKQQIKEANFRITVMLGFSGVGLVFTAIFVWLLILLGTNV